MSFITNEIVITEDHIKLLQRMYIGYKGYCEFGAPEVNPKRPYGNGNVYLDIAEILGITPSLDFNEDNGPAFTRKQEQYMLKLHKETQHALQILCQHLSIEPGKYIEHMYHDWEKV